MFDDFLEVLHIIKKNKLRTFLTGFSVAWGIFILVTLLGIGNGLKEGVLSNFRDLLQNLYFVSTGTTSMDYLDFHKGREIELKHEDYNLLVKNYPDIELISPELNHSGRVAYKKQYNTQNLQGVSPDLSVMNNIQIIKGRFINQVDLNERKKVVVISSTQNTIFFKKEDCIGKYIKFENTIFSVIGVYEDEYNSIDVPMYVPYSTLRSIYNKDIINSIVFTIRGGEIKEKNEHFIADYRNLMSHKHNFNPEDQSALRISDTSEDFQIIDRILTGITLFIWFIGISTLLSGIVGVNNIIMISVRERTREFGIRRTIGASPLSIMKSITIESSIISIISGYFGILCSVFALKLVAHILSKGQSSGDSLSLFNSPSINMEIAISTNILLLFVGILASIFPAKKAVSMNVIDAINKI